MLSRGSVHEKIFGDLTPILLVAFVLDIIAGSECIRGL